MTYQYVIILFIVTGKSEVIIKLFNTLCTIKTGWLSGNKHSFISVLLKLLVQSLVHVLPIFYCFYCN